MVTEQDYREFLNEQSQGTVTIYVHGGVATLVYRSDNVKVELLDFDNFEDQCDCGVEGGHSHEIFGETPNGS